MLQSVRIGESRPDLTHMARTTLINAPPTPSRPASGGSPMMANSPIFPYNLSSAACQLLLLTSPPFPQGCTPPFHKAAVSPPPSRCCCQPLIHLQDGGIRLLSPPPSTTLLYPPPPFLLLLLTTQTPARWRRTATTIAAPRSCTAAPSRTTPLCDFQGASNKRDPGCTAQHNTTQHSITQHNTAQHSTAQHNTAKHSTAQQAHPVLQKVNLVLWQWHPSIPVNPVLSTIAGQQPYGACILAPVCLLQRVCCT